MVSLAKNIAPVMVIVFHLISRATSTDLVTAYPDLVVLAVGSNVPMSVLVTVSATQKANVFVILGIKDLTAVQNSVSKTVPLMVFVYKTNVFAKMVGSENGARSIRHVLDTVNLSMANVNATVVGVVRTAPTL